MRLIRWVRTRVRAWFWSDPLSVRLYEILCDPAATWRLPHHTQISLTGSRTSIVRACDGLLFTAADGQGVFVGGQHVDLYPWADMRISLKIQALARPLLVAREAAKAARDREAVEAILRGAGEAQPRP